MINIIVPPAGHKICPVCNGSTRCKVHPNQEMYKRVIAGYDANTDTLPCMNCGGQSMSGRALGYTKIDPQTGHGCEHYYVAAQLRRCLTRFTCSKCKSFYDIDSGD